MWGNIPTLHGPCSYGHNPYHHVRNCPSTRQFPNYSYGHMNTSFYRSGDDSYFDSNNPAWSQLSNISWQAQDPRIHAPQFHGLQHQSYQQFYDHAYSFQLAPQQQYKAKPPPPEVSEELLETISVLIKNTEQMTQNTRQAVEQIRAHRNQQANILKKEEEEAY